MSNTVHPVPDRAVAEKPADTGAIVTAKSKPPKPHDLTVEEEQQLATYYAMCEKGQRFILLAAFEGQAHKAYNKSLPKGGTKVANFQEYAADRFGLKNDASYLSRLVNAARVERAIAGESFNMLKLTAGPDAGDQQAEFKPRLTVRAAEAISKLPEEEWQKVYEEATAIPGEATPSELSSNIQRIAGRRDRELHPDKPKPGRKAGAAAAPITRKAAAPDGPTNTAGVEGLEGQRARLKPVEAEQYEGSAEQQFIEAGGTPAEWAEKQAHLQAREGDVVTHDPGPDYDVLAEENITLRSFLKTFLALMEMKELDVAGLHTLYNDGSEWAQAHSL